MASTLCPFCKKTTHMTVVAGQIQQNGHAVRLAARCDNEECRELVLARGPVDYPNGDSWSDSDARRAIVGREATLTWLPLAAEAPAIEDVPESIARAAREAHTSAHIGNHMAAILMARTVIEATAKSQDITSGTLASKINALQAADLIRPSVAAQAHEVRFSGNDMAHGDIDIAPDEVDSEEILALMSSVLREVFQDPAQLERIKQRREQREA